MKWISNTLSVVVYFSMRTTIISICTLVLASLNLCAQIYIAPRIAHYFPVSKDLVGYQMTSPNTTGNYQFDGYYAALGSGNAYGGAIGFQSKKWWNVEVLMAVQNGICASQMVVDTANGFSNRNEDELQARMYQVKFGAAVGFLFVRSKWCFETKTSLFVGVGTQMQIDHKVVKYTNGNVYSTSEWTGLQIEGIAPGVSQQFQVGWSFTNYFRTSIGVEFVGQHWKPKRGLTASSTYNGVDQTGNYTFSQLNQEYVQSYSTSDPNSGPDSPTKIIQPMYSLNSVGVDLSIVFTIPTLKKKT